MIDTIMCEISEGSTALKHRNFIVTQYYDLARHNIIYYGLYINHMEFPEDTIWGYHNTTS